MLLRCWRGSWLQSLPKLHVAHACTGDRRELVSEAFFKCMGCFHSDPNLNLANGDLLRQSTQSINWRNIVPITIRAQ